MLTPERTEHPELKFIRAAAERTADATVFVLVEGDRRQREPANSGRH